MLDRLWLLLIKRLRKWLREPLGLLVHGGPAARWLSGRGRGMLGGGGKLIHG